ncbi:MAG: sel1 repeat family protein [Magnetococcales bacterium]|nr:sel1 repeat family protein [Magnetococcales bacterium]
MDRKTTNFKTAWVRWLAVWAIGFAGIDSTPLAWGEQAFVSLLRGGAGSDERLQMILGQALIAVDGWNPDQHPGGLQGNVEGLIRAANQGDGLAALNLVVLYQSGGWVAKDGHRAFHWLQKIVSGSNVSGLTPDLLTWVRLKVGLAYLEGEGVAQDRAMARHWLQMAADSGSAYAEFTLGQMDLSDAGGDAGSARKRFQHAASLGFIPAQEALKRTAPMSSHR